MKTIFKKIEVKKFNKLANDTDTVLFTSGNEINYIYNKRTGKRYYPKNTLFIER